ncbi:hypothetical protein ACJX0J_033015 [Zea mays]
MHIDACYSPMCVNIFTGNIGSIESITFLHIGWCFYTHFGSKNLSWDMKTDIFYVHVLFHDRLCESTKNNQIYLYNWYAMTSKFARFMDFPFKVPYIKIWHIHIIGISNYVFLTFSHEVFGGINQYIDLVDRVDQGRVYVP